VLKHSTGNLDGVNVNRLLPGLVYEVPVSLGVFLISRHAAEEVVVTGSPVSVQTEDAVISLLRGGVVRLPSDDV